MNAFTKQLIFSFFLSLTLLGRTTAQEVISPLIFNETILQEVQKKNSTLSHQKVISGNSASGTTSLSIPFMDDFAKEGIYPDENLWSDKDVFINDNLPYFPPTIGVATFDGVDLLGSPYDFSSSTTYGVADYLTSLPIRLDSVGNIALSPADSLYISFFYQPQGRGEQPDGEDSLVLEFWNPVSLDWEWQWSVPGRPVTNDTAFRYVLIPVLSPDYFNDGFKFRFFNYANLSANADHWHLDYVLLDRNRSFNDIYLNDVAFVIKSGTVLLNFQQLPWRHYLTDKANQTKTSLRNTIANLSDFVKTIQIYKLSVYDDTNTLLNEYTGGSENVNPFSTNGYHNHPAHINPTFNNNVFPADANDEAVFEIRHMMQINDTIRLARWNDTMRFYQRFMNYYAYDDGSAEWGYGLNSINGKIACRFVSFIPDTLRGVFIHFNRLFENVSTRTFAPAVWKDNNGKPGVLWYQGAAVQPKYINGINGFYFYEFNPPIAVTDTFYVGWIQNTDKLLNIGLDYNTNSNINMFYNATGNWNQSLIQGTWMIRPALGKPVRPDINAGENYIADLQDFSIFLFPNPAKDKINIQISADHHFNFPDYSSLQFSVYDNIGRMVSKGMLEANSINVSELPSGFFILKIDNRSSGKSVTKKFIINR